MMGSGSYLSSKIKLVVKKTSMLWKTIIGDRPHHGDEDVMHSHNESSSNLPGEEDVMHSHNESSSNLPERPVMSLGNGSSSGVSLRFPREENSKSQCQSLSKVRIFDNQNRRTFWSLLWFKAWRLLSNKIQRDELKTGDHIYTWRHGYFYAHHGIYEGDGKVVHYTRGGSKKRIIFSSSPSLVSESLAIDNDPLSRLDQVEYCSLDDFLLGGELYLFEYGVSLAHFIFKTRGGTCTLAASAPLEVVLDRLKYHHKNGFGSYHLFKNNCEDFSIYCKTGFHVADYYYTVGRSGQAASVVIAVTAFICSTIRNPGVGMKAAHFIMGYAIYSVCRWASDIGVRGNIRKAADGRLGDGERSFGHRFRSKFNSALLKRHVVSIVMLGVWWICCCELQLTTEYLSFLLGWIILSATAWRFLFVPIDPAENKNNKGRFLFVPIDPAENKNNKGCSRFRLFTRLILFERVEVLRFCSLKQKST